MSLQRRNKVILFSTGLEIITMNLKCMCFGQNN